MNKNNSWNENHQKSFGSSSDEKKNFSQRATAAQKTVWSKTRAKLSRRCSGEPESCKKLVRFELLNIFSFIQKTAQLFRMNFDGALRRLSLPLMVSSPFFFEINQFGPKSERINNFKQKSVFVVSEKKFFANGLAQSVQKFELE